MIVKCTQYRSCAKQCGKYYEGDGQRGCPATDCYGQSAELLSSRATQYNVVKDMNLLQYITLHLMHKEYFYLFQFLQNPNGIFIFDKL